MTITIREQVLAALRNNPGLNSVKLAGLIGNDGLQVARCGGYHSQLRHSN